MMSYETIKYEKNNSAAVITISRPKALNALNTQVLEELFEALTAAEADADVAGVIITGEGKAFVAGADISEMKDQDAAGGLATAKRGHRVMSLIEGLSKPVIAAVNGFALGGGSELALACDFRIASTKAKLGQPEVNLGILPGFGGTQRLARQVGKGNALYLILTAEMIGAEKALQMGLVQEVVEPDALMDRALELMELIAAKGPLGVRLSKRLIHTGYEMDQTSALAMEEEMFGFSFSSEEQTEGMTAFLEKRKPNFKGLK